jgi:hypothetical protein
MPLPVVPGIWRVNLIQELFGAEVENVFHISPDESIPTGTDLGEIANSWNTIVQPVQTDDVQLTDVKITVLDSTPTVLAADVRGASLFGTATGPTCSPNIAMGWSLRTALPTRRGRGRTFLPGIPTSSLLSTDTSRWNSGLAGTYSGLMDSFFADLAGLSNSLTAGVLSVLDLEWRVVTSTIWRQDIRTQRRRLS